MKKILIILLTVIVSILFASGQKGTYVLLDNNLPGILSAVLGGLLASISIIVGVISVTSSRIKRIAEKSDSFNSFITKLGKDLNYLIACLFASVVLPYIRNLNLISTQIYIDGKNINSYYQHAISSLEIFILIISFMIIYEISSVLILILKSFTVKN